MVVVGIIKNEGTRFPMDYDFTHGVEFCDVLATEYVIDLHCGVLCSGGVTWLLGVIELWDFIKWEFCMVWYLSIMLCFVSRLMSYLLNIRWL